MEVLSRRGRNQVTGPSPCECHPDRKHFARGFCKHCYFSICKAGSHRKSRYGLDQNAVEKLYVSQCGSCAVCSRIFTENEEPCVDHNHATGAVRGLVCKACNWKIGMLLEPNEKLILWTKFGRQYLQEAA
ncbi:MAG: hypothetical protein KGL39_36590 [Patescibacteria group bacterium]|nr:hypothetical protein [Patescibacteria group bacterium]